MFFRAIYLNKTTVLIGQSEGLPNITGAFDRPTRDMLGPVSGAFFLSDYVGGFSRDTSRDSSMVAFDASKGETKTDGTLKTGNDYKVFGKSNHVTPCNATIKVWQRIS